MVSEVGREASLGSTRRSLDRRQLPLLEEHQDGQGRRTPVSRPTPSPPPEHQPRVREQRKQSGSGAEVCGGNSPWGEGGSAGMGGTRDVLRARQRVAAGRSVWDTGETGVRDDDMNLGAWEMKLQAWKVRIEYPRAAVTNEPGG